MVDSSQAVLRSIVFWSRLKNKVNNTNTNNTTSNNTNNNTTIIISVYHFIFLLSN